MNAPEFANAARAIGESARAAGWQVPSFRSPPGLVGVNRTLRRGSEVPVASIRHRGRSPMAVVADMIEAVVVVNHLQPPDSDRARDVLWGVLAPVGRGDASGDEAGGAAA